MVVAFLVAADIAVNKMFKDMAVSPSDIATLKKEWDECDQAERYNLMANEKGHAWNTNCDDEITHLSFWSITMKIVKTQNVR